MLKKTITYVDYDGTERTEDFYFNLTKAEILEMQLSTAGTLQRTLERIVAEKDQVKIMQYFKEIILKAYGKKSDDGKRFMKSQQLIDEFTQTEAYSQLYVELATNSEAAAAFINAIIPQQDKPSIPAPPMN